MLSIFFVHFVVVVVVVSFFLVVVVSLVAFEQEFTSKFLFSLMLNLFAEWLLMNETNDRFK